MIPGVTVTLRETPQPVSLQIDTGTAFVVGLTDRGPLTPTLEFNLDDFVTDYGDRQTYSPLYDWLDVFFREGGARAIVARVVGPAATSGIRNLMDNAAAVSLVATAIGPGAWSANYKVAVIAGTGGTFKIQVTDAANVVLEDSGELVNQNAAVVWSQFSNYIRLTLGASALNPIPAAAAALSAGNDDRVNAVDANWATAIAQFTDDLGPGQVVAPGRTTDVAHTQLNTHAETFRRVALLDFADTPTVGTLQSSANFMLGKRFSAGFAPWVVVPGLVSGTTRTVPASSLVAGLIGRNDPSNGTNSPSAGNNGVAKYVYELSQPDWGTNLQTLNSSGVNVIRRFKGGIRVYGWRSMANPTTDKSWLSFGNSRLFTAISAELKEVGENYEFEEIDGQNGKTIGGFHSALYGVLLRHFNAGELFGDSADQAFSVDTGNNVNTLARLAALELHAVCQVKMSPFAEAITIEIVKRQLTEVI